MSMTPPSPETAKRFPQWRLFAAIFASLVLLLAIWYFLLLRRDYTVLYRDLRAPEAAAIVAELEKQGVRYRLGEGGTQISVPAADADAVQIGLASSDLPIRGVEGFELFNESDMGLTDFAQKIRYQRALQGELARTIMMMEGVAEARVHISMPERALFRAERRNAEAAVTLVMRSPDDETPARIEGVQRLVAAAVMDLSVADVVVLNGRGDVISPRVEMTPLNSAQVWPTDPNGPSLDFVMEVMRRALTDTRFEVSIEQATPDLAGAADDATPAVTRIVHVVTETPLGLAQRERVREELRRANIVDGASGGTVAFQVAPPTFAEPQQQATAATTEPSASERASPWLAAGIGMLIALLVIGGIALTLRWLRRPLLSADDHKRFADRLKAGMAPLEQGGGGG